MVLWLKEYRFVLVGGVGAVLSGIAAWSTESLALRIVGVLAAAVAIAVLIWQHEATKPLRIEIAPEKWIEHGLGREYVISRKTARGRRVASTYESLPEGIEEEVICDVHVLDNGDVRLKSGVPFAMVVYLR